MEITIRGREEPSITKDSRHLCSDVPRLTSDFLTSPEFPYLWASKKVSLTNFVDLSQPKAENNPDSRGAHPDSFGIVSNFGLTHKIIKEGKKKNCC
jgi:hypothetical protein